MLSRSSPYQQRGHLSFAAIDSPPQRSVAQTIARIQLGAAIQQSFRDFDIAPTGGHVQRRAPLRAAVGVHVRAVPHKQSHHVRATRSPLVRYAIERRMTAAILRIDISPETEE